MRLYVLRHGLAEDVGDDGTDAGRHLTELGRERVRAAANGLAALGMRPDVLLTSPVIRARETAEIIGHVLQRKPEIVQALQTGSSAHGVVRALGAYEASARVMIVGHEPTLSELVALLLTGSARGMAVRFKQSACVTIALQSINPPRGAVLRSMLTARQLGAVVS